MAFQKPKPDMPLTKEDHPDKFYDMKILGMFQVTVRNQKDSTELTKFNTSEYLTSHAYICSLLLLVRFN
jgi:hypothetical protein